MKRICESVQSYPFRETSNGTLTLDVSYSGATHLILTVLRNSPSTILFPNLQYGLIKYSG